MHSTNSKRLLIVLSIALVVIGVAAAYIGGQAQTISTMQVTGAQPAPHPATRQNNPNYPIPNPFYFEGKIDYELLGIDTPQNTWEFMQRGIHEQDDLEDFTSAIADYRTSLSTNSLQNGTCQIVTTQPVPSTLNPAPCMFTVRSRLGYLLLQQGNADEAISLFNEVLQIDPRRLEINALIGEAYMQKADNAPDATTKSQNLSNAIAAFKAELALSPVTQQSMQLTGDQANNSDVHWNLAAIYQELQDTTDAISELNLYLKATQWHSDTYPWRIPLAQKQIAALGGTPDSSRKPGRRGYAGPRGRGK